MFGEKGVLAGGGSPSGGGRGAERVPFMCRHYEGQALRRYVNRRRGDLVSRVHDCPGAGYVDMSL